MKSYFDRAKEYVQRVYQTPYSDVELGFVRGAQSEHKELTKWNAPSSIPNDGRDVLVKGICGTGGGEFYAVAYKIHGVLMSGGGVLDEADEIIGWREIHE